MEDGRAPAVTIERKRKFSRRVRESAFLRFGLRIVARIMAPRQPVGAVAAVFDDRGRVLLVEHVFRTDFPWGLPGGYVHPGEEPSEAVRREVEEELGFRISVGPLVHTAQVGLVANSTHPKHLGLAYACKLLGGACRTSAEVVSFEWVPPNEIHQTLSPFQQAAALRAAEILSHGECKFG